MHGMSALEKRRIERWDGDQAGLKGIQRARHTGEGRRCRRHQVESPAKLRPSVQNACLAADQQRWDLGLP